MSDERAKRLADGMFQATNPVIGLPARVELSRQKAHERGPRGWRKPENLGVVGPREPKGRPLTQPADWHTHRALGVTACGTCGTLVHPGQILRSRVHPTRPRLTLYRCLRCPTD